MSLYLSEDTVSVSPKPVPLPDFEEPEEKSAAAKVSEQKPAPASAGDAMRHGVAAPLAADNLRASAARPKAVKTVFEYKGPGKTVTIAGSFSVWREIKMSRKDGAWRAEVYILPGSYTYHFTVDGKKTADPGKPKAPTGDSIVSVE